MPSFNAADGTFNVGGNSSITFTSAAAAAGSNRILLAWPSIGTGSTPAAPTSVTWGGQALTIRGARFAIHANVSMTLWYILEANFPGGATGNLVASYADSHDENTLQWMVVNDVNQAAPFRNADATRTQGTNAAPTQTGTSDASDLWVAGMFDVDFSGDITGVTVTAGTSADEIEVVTGGSEGAFIAYRSGATPTISGTVDGTDGTTIWGMMGESLQAASGGASSILRQMLQNH